MEEEGRGIDLFTPDYAKPFCISPHALAEILLPVQIRTTENKKPFFRLTERTASIISNELLSDGGHLT